MDAQAFLILLGWLTAIGICIGLLIWWDIYDEKRSRSHFTESDESNFDN